MFNSNSIQMLLSWTRWILLLGFWPSSGCLQLGRDRWLLSPPSPTMASTSAPAPAPPAIVSLASPISENSPQKFEFPPDQPLPFKVTEFCSTDSNPPSTPRPPESTSSTPLSSASVSVVIPSYASKTLLNPFAPHCFSLLLRLSSAFGFRLHIPDPYALFRVFFLQF